MAPTNRGVAKQVQNQRPTAATPVYGHDGTSIVYNQQPQSNSNRTSFPSLNIPFPNVPPGVTRHDASIDTSPFSHFAQQQQQPFNGMNMGVNPMGFNQHQQFNPQDPLSASSSAPTPTPTPGPNGNGFQGGYYSFGNNNQMRMAPNSNNFYPGGAAAHSGTLGPMFGNGMQSIQEPFAAQSMQQQGQYGMPYNMGFPFPGQQQQPNSQPFNVQGNMYNMVPFNNSANSDLSSYEPPSTSSSDTPPDRDFSVNGDGGMDVELDLESDLIATSSYNLVSPTTEMLTSPASDRTSCVDNGPMDPVVKGEDFGPNALSPPVLGEAKSITSTPTLSKTSSTPVAGSTGKPSLPSSKEKEQNKQKLYRNRKSEFTNKMRDELLGMGMLPSTRVTHAPEIMSKTADTLRDYRELLELIQNKIEGMPTNIAAVPGAVKKLLNENANVFNNLRQAPQLSLAQQTQQQQSQPVQQQTGSHGFKPDIKVPLGTNMTGATNQGVIGRVTRSGAHAY